MAQCAGERRRGYVAGDGGHRHARRNSEKDQERRHQEATADTKHPRYEADCQPHRKKEEDIYRQISDWQIDLQFIIPIAWQKRAEVPSFNDAQALAGVLQEKRCPRHCPKRHADFFFGERSSSILLSHFISCANANASSGAMKTVSFSAG